MRQVNNRHCISPDEDAANGKLIVDALNGTEALQAKLSTLEQSLREILELMPSNADIDLIRGNVGLGFHKHSIAFNDANIVRWRAALSGESRQ